MKRLLLALALLMPAASFGASLGYQQSTSLSTSSAINLPTIPTSPGPGSALVTVESSGVRWRDDGTDPTSTVGNPVAAGQALCYGNEIAKFRVIGQTSGAAIDVTYYAGKGCAQ